MAGKPKRQKYMDRSVKKMNPLNRFFYNFSRTAKTKPLKFLSYILIYILFLSYIAGIIGQKMTSGISDILMGPAGVKNNTPLIYNPLKIIPLVVKDYFWIAAVMFMLTLLLLLFLKSVAPPEKDEFRGYTVSDTATYGGAKLQSFAEMTDQFFIENIAEDKASEFIFGQYDELAVMRKRDDDPVNKRRNKKNEFVFLLGIAGKGKSAGYSFNYVYQTIRQGKSLVATDPKCEIYNETKPALERAGYKVRILNLTDPEHSDSWDALREIFSDAQSKKKREAHISQQAMIFADTIIANASGGNAFWDDTSKNYLRAGCIYVALEDEFEDRRTFPAVYNLLTQTPQEEVEGKFEALKDDHPAKAAWNVFIAAPDQVRSATVSGLGLKLSVLQNKLTASILSHNDMPIEALGKEKCAYFLRISTQNTAFEFISSLFFAMLFEKLVTLAEKNQNLKLDIPVNLLLDEFCNIGLIPAFESKPATIRSYGFGILLAVQSIPLLKTKYPGDQWEAIISNCDSWICMGSMDNTTSKYLSEKMGTVTIKKSTESSRVNLLGMRETMGHNESESEDKTKLFNPEDFENLSDRKAIIKHGNGNPVILDTFFYQQHPFYKKNDSIDVRDYIPAWALKERLEDAIVELEYAQRRNEPTDELLENIEVIKRNMREHNMGITDDKDEPVTASVKEPSSSDTVHNEKGGNTVKGGKVSRGTSTLLMEMDEGNSEGIDIDDFLKGRYDLKSAKKKNLKKQVSDSPSHGSKQGASDDGIRIVTDMGKENNESYDESPVINIEDEVNTETDEVSQEMLNDMMNGHRDDFSDDFMNEPEDNQDTGSYKSDDSDLYLFGNTTSEFTDEGQDEEINF